jgi:HAD superfamily hydrolase (TIGR01544 family)
MNIIISNPEKFTELKKKFKDGGVENVHVISDFDRTLTYGNLDGVKTPSIISMLRDGNHLSEDYAKRAHELFDKYHPIEVSDEATLSEKKEAMKEWWDTHNKLLVESGLTKDDLKDIVENGHLQFREGIFYFMDFLDEREIPFVILSASGAGDAIEMFFEDAGLDYDNIHYITNQFVWDETGRAVGVKEPVIHSMNKDETVVSEIPSVFEEVRGRRNVILLGDSLSDIDMVAGFEYDNLIKIGFLNDKIDQHRKQYTENFDIVVEGDGDLSFVNELLEEII